MEDFMLAMNRIKNDDQHLESLYDFNAFLQYLQKAKTALSARQRQIFEMNREQHMPAEQIALELGISEQSVRNQLSAALKILRENFQKSML